MHESKKNYWIAFTFFTLALIPRLIRLDYQSLWYEELMTLKFSTGESFSAFLKGYIAHPDFHPPLYPIFIYMLKSLGINSEWGLKLPSVLFGAGSASIVYLLGEKLYNRRTGLLAGLMMSLSGASVYYSQEIRYSSALVFFTLLLTWVSLQESRYKIIWLSLTGLVLSYLHYTAFLFTVVSLLFFALKNLNWNQGKPYYISTFIVLLGFLPWSQVMLAQTESWSIYREYNQNPNWFIYFFKMLDFSFLYQTYWQGVPHLVEVSTLKIFFYFFIAKVALYQIYVFFKEKSYSLNLNDLYLYGIIIGSITAFFAHDLLSSKKYFYEKALLYTVPYIYLLTGSLISASIKKSIEFIVVAIYIGSLFIFQPFINQSYYSVIFKTEFKQMTEFVFKTSPQSPIIVACGDPAWYQYYLNNHQTQVIYSSEEKILNDIDNLNSDSFWIISAHCVNNTDLLWSDKLVIENNYQPKTLVSALLVRKK